MSVKLKLMQRGALPVDMRNKLSCPELGKSCFWYLGRLGTYHNIRIRKRLGVWPFFTEVKYSSSLGTYRAQRDTREAYQMAIDYCYTNYVEDVEKVNDTWNSWADNETEKEIAAVVTARANLEATASKSRKTVNKRA